MLKSKRNLWLLIAIGLATFVLTIYFMQGMSSEKLQVWLKHAGIWAPIIYISLYTAATMAILPSTALNLVGGATFGVWAGTVWTSIGAVTAALLAFWFARTIGRTAIAERMAGHWQAMDVEIQQGGLFYIFAIRLLPIIPYGLVNFAAGLTSISFKDYALGTLLGTVPGVFPFVLLGSSGLRAVQAGDIFPFVVALALIGVLVAGAARYRRFRLKQGVKRKLRDPRRQYFHK